MTYPLLPVDDIIGPTLFALSNILTTQIAGLGRMYVEVPDGPPESNSVLFPVIKCRFEGDTNGKVYICLMVGIRYLLRRSKGPDNLAQLYTMFSAFARVLSSWPNQTLGGIDITVTPKEAGFTQMDVAGIPFMAMVMNTEVRTEFNILVN